MFRRVAVLTALALLASTEASAGRARARLAPAKVPGLWKDAAGRRVGFNGFRADDSYVATTYQWRQHIPAAAFLVAAHGIPGRFQELDTRLTIAGFARHAARFEHVFLQVCSGAVPDARGKSLADKIARATRRPVVAANGDIMGDTVMRKAGRTELVVVVFRMDLPVGMSPVLLPDQQWVTVYPDGRREPVVKERYFRKFAAVIP